MSRSCTVFIGRNNTASEQQICIYKKIFVIIYKMFTNIIIILIIIWYHHWRYINNYMIHFQKKLGYWLCSFDIYVQYYNFKQLFYYIYPILSVDFNLKKESIYSSIKYWFNHLMGKYLEIREMSYRSILYCVQTCRRAMCRVGVYSPDPFTIIEDLH